MRRVQRRLFYSLLCEDKDVGKYVLVLINVSGITELISFC